MHAFSVKREGFGKVSDAEGVLLIFQSVFDFEVEPLLVAFSVGVHVKVQVIFVRFYILSFL